MHSWRMRQHIGTEGWARVSRLRVDVLTGNRANRSFHFPPTYSDPAVSMYLCSPRRFLIGRGTRRTRRNSLSPMVEASGRSSGDKCECRCVETYESRATIMEKTDWRRRARGPTPITVSFYQRRSRVCTVDVTLSYTVG